jgi:hypothetical protein
LPWSQKPIPILPAAYKWLPSFDEAIGYMFLRNCGTLKAVINRRATIRTPSLEDLTQYKRVETTNRCARNILDPYAFPFLPVPKNVARCYWLNTYDKLQERFQYTLIYPRFYETRTLSSLTHAPCFHSCGLFHMICTLRHDPAHRLIPKLSTTIVHLSPGTYSSV